MKSINHLSLIKNIWTTNIFEINFVLFSKKKIFFLKVFNSKQKLKISKIPLAEIFGISKTQFKKKIEYQKYHFDKFWKYWKSWKMLELNFLLEQFYNFFLTIPEPKHVTFLILSKFPVRFEIDSRRLSEFTAYMFQFIKIF